MAETVETANELIRFGFQSEPGFETIECVILDAIHGSGSSIARRMRRDNEVQYPPPPVFGDKKQ